MNLNTLHNLYLGVYPTDHTACILRFFFCGLRRSLARITRIRSGRVFLRLSRFPIAIAPIVGAIKSRSPEDKPGSWANQPSHRSTALRTFRQRLGIHTLKHLERMATPIALVFIRRHISSHFRYRTTRSYTTRIPRRQLFRTSHTHRDRRVSPEKKGTGSLPAPFSVYGNRPMGFRVLPCPPLQRCRRSQKETKLSSPPHNRHLPPLHPWAWLLHLPEDAPVVIRPECLPAAPGWSADTSARQLHARPGSAPP